LIELLISQLDLLIIFNGPCELLKLVNF